MRGETDDRGGFRVVDSDPADGLWVVPDDDGDRNALDWHPLAFARTSGHERMAWPVFADPATLGCLLALVREALGRPHLRVNHYHGWWEVEDPDDEHFDATDGGFGALHSEPEALVAALEVAP